MNDDKADDQKEDDALSKSIMLVTNVLSESECRLLRAEADRLLNGDGGLYRRDLLQNDDDDDNSGDDDKDDESDDGTDDEGALRRVSLCDATADAQSLSNDLIFRRVLPALRRDAPELLDRLGLSEYDAPNTFSPALTTTAMTTSSSVVNIEASIDENEATTDKFDWAADEPSINRYTVGGKFDPHRDGYALTVVVSLSEDGAFDGGGTCFFESSEEADAYMDVGGDEAAAGAVRDGQQQDIGLDEDDDVQILSQNGSVLVKPPLGSAVLFGGDLLHAGCPVTSGVRHVYVASFSLKEDENADAI